MQQSAPPNVFATLFKGARDNPKQDQQLAKRNLKKFERIQNDRKQLESKRADQRVTNTAAKKRERDADPSDILGVCSSLPLPSNWLAPPWDHGSQNTTDLHLYVVGHKSYEVPAFECPQDMIKTHPNPKRQNLSQHIQDMRERLYQQNREKHASRKVRVCENRLDCVDSNGCPTTLRVHGHERSFLVRAPDNVAARILKSAFPEEMASAVLAHRIPLPPIPAPAGLDNTEGKVESVIARKEREERLQAYLDQKKVSWAEVRKQRDHLLHNNSVAGQYCQQVRDALDLQLDNDKSWEYVSGDHQYSMISSVRPMLRQSVVGFDHDEQSVYFQITCSLPRVQNTCYDILKHKGIILDGKHHVFTDAEFGNVEINYDLQFLVENRLAGHTWITLPAYKYQIVTGPVPAEMVGRVCGNRREYEENSGSDSGGEDGSGGGDNSARAKRSKRVHVQHEFNQSSSEEDLYQDSDENATKRTMRKTWYRAELDISYRDLISHYRSKEKRWQRIVSLRTDSFDIECGALIKGRFPVANPKDEYKQPIQAEPGDPIISISVVRQETNGVRKKVVMTWKLPENKRSARHAAADPDAINLDDQDCEVEMYRDERDMLLGLAEKWRSGQVSVITGYNILNFDLKYLMDRAEKLDIPTFAFLTGVKEITLMKESVMQSKAFGRQDRLDALMPGTLVFDLCRYIINNEKYSSYTLNHVAGKILNSSKDDLHHSLITEMFYGTQAQRRRLLKYNLRDSILPLDIIKKKKITFGEGEIARVCGVTNHVLNTSGQGIKTESQLQRLMAEAGYVAPILRHKNQKAITTMEEMIESEEVQYEGAICVEPMTGFYTIPIATLDFASLYPSVMMAYNLDYSTILMDPENDLKRLKEGDYIKVTCGRGTPDDPNATADFYFVKKHIRQGQCPLLLANLVGERSVIKRELKTVDEHSEEAAILEKRSLALKLSANSTYGFCAGFVLHLPAISECVCALGRQALMRTITLVENHFTIANGYQHDAKVIYGDTDSVMIKFGVTTVKEASKLAREAEKLVNDSFADLKPMAVEFEKIYMPYLLMIKKNYAGLKWAPDTEEAEYEYNPSHPAAIKAGGNYAPKAGFENAYVPTIDYKGIEPKRRDKIGFIKRVMLQALDYILWERNVERAVSYCKDQITQLMRGEVDFSEIIKSKSYKEGQANRTPQSEVAEKMKKRDPANAPVNGSRVAWVPICQPGKGKDEAKKCETAEEPLYALNRRLPIDWREVAESDVKNALFRLLKYCFYAPERSLEQNKQHSTASLEDMFSPIYNVYEVDDRPMGGPMAKFCKPVDTCQQCNTPIRLHEELAAMAAAEVNDGDVVMAGAEQARGRTHRPGTRVLCAHCVDHLPTLREKTQNKLNDLQKEHDKVWDACAKCSEAPLDCSNIDCKIFFRRIGLRDRLGCSKTKLANIDW